MMSRCRTVRHPVRTKMIPMEKLFLIDAYALIFRAYYAFIGRPMRNAEGLNTSAIFGFVKFLRDLIRREDPRLLGVAFDPKGGNFRHEIYPQYKANREATPEDIIQSVPYIKRILEALQIPVIEIAGYEADDVIGTLSMKAAAAGYEVYMVTPDKDYGQLIRPTVRIYKPRKGSEGIEIVGCEQIKEHYGIDDPTQVIDILALWGDAAGIGEKSAIKLVGQFGTVENLLEHTDQLKGKQRENIEASHDQILLAKRLATIDLNVPVEFDPQALAMEAPDVEMLAALYRELGFRSFLNEIQPNPFLEAKSHHVAKEGEKMPSMQDAKSQNEEKSASSSISSATVASNVKSLHGASVQGDLFGSLADQSVGTPTKQPAEVQNAVGDLFAQPALATVKKVTHQYHVVSDQHDLQALVDRFVSIRKQPAWMFLVTGWWGYRLPWNLMKRGIFRVIVPISNRC